MLLGLTLSQLITNMFVLLIAMTVHEFAHSYAAYLAGDTTAADQGRLTLNPFVHIHWIGFAMFALIGFGILGSAPVNAQRMRNPRWGHLFAVAAGPLSNLLLAIVAALPVRFGLVSIADCCKSELIPNLPELVGAFIFLNLLLFVFNLLPLSPLDGWHIVHDLLPEPTRNTWGRHAQTSYYIFIGLLLWSFVGRGLLNPFNFLIFRPTIAIASFLLG